jgi:O-antigen/teichoic acid export membrane protein
VINNILNTFGARLFSALLNLLIAIIISRFLGPEGKGQQGLIIATITYVLVFANLMGGSAIVYLVPRFSWSLIVLPAYLWSVLTSMAFYFALSVFQLIDQGFILHVAILSLISAFTAINSSLLIGKEKITTSNLVAFVQPLATALALSVLFFGMGQNTIQSYLLSLYISFGLAFLLSIFFLGRFTSRFRLSSRGAYFEIIRHMLRYGLLNQLAHIFQLLSFRMSYYWLEQTYSSAEVGVYSNGASLVESIWLISRSISLVLYARIANTSDKLYAQKISMQLALGSLFISFTGLIVLVLLPSQVFVFVFGDGFHEIGLVIRSLAPGVLLFSLALVLGHYFSGTGKYHVNTIASFAGLVVAVIAFNFMIPAYGITGAGWATSISYTITSAIVIIYFARESKIKLKEAIPGFSEIKAVLRTKNK